MAAVQGDLPEDLARKTEAAGLLAPDAIETRQREAVRRKAAARAFLDDATARKARRRRTAHGR